MLLRRDEDMALPKSYQNSCALKLSSSTFSTILQALTSQTLPLPKYVALLVLYIFRIEKWKSQ